VSVSSSRSGTLTRTRLGRFGEGTLEGRGGRRATIDGAVGCDGRGESNVEGRWGYDAEGRGGYDAEGRAGYDAGGGGGGYTCDARGEYGGGV
jgi:hypothetical protein